MLSKIFMQIFSDSKMNASAIISLDARTMKKAPTQVNVSSVLQTVAHGPDFGGNFTSTAGRCIFQMLA